MLTLDNVSAHYGKIQALHNVSIQIQKGEIVTLIGANGAGKRRCWVRYAVSRERLLGASIFLDKTSPTGRRLALCARQ